MSRAARMWLRAAAAALIAAILALAVQNFFHTRPPSPAALKIGQTIMIGFHGKSAADPRFKDVLRQLETGLIGGVLFLGHNIGAPQDVAAMTAAIRQCRCQLPPLIAIDEEGGRVQRLRKSWEPGSTPSAKSTAAAGEAEATRIYAELAQKVASAGFNLNFGPVVDLDLNPANPIIGQLGRSFSADPAMVERFARIFINAHRKQGVLTALKHFPGHGSGSADSHDGVVDVTNSWRKEELAPYRALITEGLAEMVMVGHIAGAAWNGTASLSPATAISGLLRGELGYQGVVISDDLEMGAVQQADSDFGKAVVRAAAAGNDIVLFSNRLINRPRAGDWINALIEDALISGKIPQASLVASHQRITVLKARLRG